MEGWSELLPDILLQVCDHLDFRHFLRLGGVCRSWRSVVAHYAPCGPRVVAPWLIPDRHENFSSSTTVRFFDLNENRQYSIKQPPAAGRRHFLGSDFGWVVAIDTKDSRFSLLNPISRRRIVLPPLFLASPTRNPLLVRVLRYVEGRGPIVCSEEMRGLPRKAMLSSSPDRKGHEDWTVVVNFHHPSDHRRLAYIRHRDDMWTMVDVSVPIYDVICHQGLIYVLSEGGKISTWDLGTRPAKSTLIFWPTVPVDIKSVKLGYLVPCPRGDFLQVWRHEKEQSTPRFAKVFRVDLEEQELVKTNSLDGCVIFAGRNAPICVSSEFSSDDDWFYRDCIYFSDQRFRVGYPVSIYNVAGDVDASLCVPKLIADVYGKKSCSIWFIPFF